MDRHDLPTPELNTTETCPLVSRILAILILNVFSYCNSSHHHVIKSSVKRTIEFRLGCEPSPPLVISR